MPEAQWQTGWRNYQTGLCYGGLAHAIMSGAGPIAMLSVNRYRDRHEAGQKLARALHAPSATREMLVLALPRGGAAIGLEIARSLHAPLDVFVVRKLGMPGHEEFALGAIASGGVQLLDEERIADEYIPEGAIAEIMARETAELHRREALYRHGRPPLAPAGRQVILADDGIATGYTMRTAIAALRHLRPAAITVAIPVGPPDTCEAIDHLVDVLVCPLRPDPFHAVGLWYEHFPQLSDDDVCAALAEAGQWARA